MGRPRRGREGDRALAPAVPRRRRLHSRATPTTDRRVAGPVSPTGGRSAPAVGEVDGSGRRTGQVSPSAATRSTCTGDARAAPCGPASRTLACPSTTGVAAEHAQRPPSRSAEVLVAEGERGLGDRARARSARAAAHRRPRRPRRRRRTPARRTAAPARTAARSAAPARWPRTARRRRGCTPTPGPDAARRAPPRPDGRAARSRCRACCARTPGTPARSSGSPVEPSSGRSSRSRVVVGTSPQRSDWCPSRRVGERPAARGRRAACGPDGGSRARAPLRAPARARAPAATAASKRDSRSPARPHGPGCSTSSSRAAGNAVPSIGSPRSCARSAHRFDRLARAADRGRPHAAISQGRSRPRAAAAAPPPSCSSASRPGSSAGREHLAGQHRLQRVGSRDRQRHACGRAARA